jgi:nucleoid-associated protein YgaU
VAQRSIRKTASRTGARASGRGHQALDRLNESIEAAEKALKDLRAEMSRGSRTLLKDVDSTLRDARKHVRSVRTGVAKDLEQLQKAASGKKPAAKKSTARKSTARKPAAKKATAGRATAAKATAKKSTTAKKSDTARKTSTRSSAARRKRAAR